jgi:hypothetical protein
MDKREWFLKRRYENDLLSAPLLVARVLVDSIPAEVLEAEANILVVLVPQRLDLIETTTVPLCIYEAPKGNSLKLIYAGSFTYLAHEGRESP